MTGEPTRAIERTGFAGPRRRRWRRRRVIIELSLLVIAGCAGAAASHVSDRPGSNRLSGSNGFATSLAAVTRRSLSETTQFNGTLGYVGSYTVLGQAQGTVTWLPKAGQLIRDGQVLYRVNDSPVVLLHGSIPVYRPLADGITGRDVTQLNRDLVALGYLTKSAVGQAWHQFGRATTNGLDKLQEHLGTNQTGRLSQSDVVFLPTAARVTTVNGTVGAPATPPEQRGVRFPAPVVLMTATSTVATVSIALDPSLRSEVSPGDQVTITLPNSRTTTGTVTSVGTVATTADDDDGASAETGPTVTVHIRPTHPGATVGLDQASVQVAITDRTVHDALAVPVDALLAGAGGSYAVEVVAGNGEHHLVRVSPGLFDDAAGLVQVTHTALAAGQRVVVPGQ